LIFLASPSHQNHQSAGHLYFYQVYHGETRGIPEKNPFFCNPHLSGKFHFVHLTYTA